MVDNFIELRSNNPEDLHRLLWPQIPCEAVFLSFDLRVIATSQRNIIAIYTSVRRTSPHRSRADISNSRTFPAFTKHKVAHNSIQIFTDVFHYSLFICQSTNFHLNGSFMKKFILCAQRHFTSTATTRRKSTPTRHKAQFPSCHVFSRHCNISKRLTANRSSSSFRFRA